MRTCRVIKSGVCAITQVFKSKTHKGIDLTDVNSKGQHITGYITAHSDGVVSCAYGGCNKTYATGSSYGNYIIIDHEDGYRTLYAHLKYGSLEVKRGQKVKTGQIIGFIGNTGHSSGAHLHFEVRDKRGEKIDPEPFLFAPLPAQIKHDTVAVDGMWGKGTTTALQQIFGCTVTGLITGQSVANKKYYHAISESSWQFTGATSPVILLLQKKIKATQDGKFGPKSIKALQQMLGVTQDGELGPKTVTALQKWINKQ